MYNKKTVIIVFIVLAALGAFLIYTVFTYQNGQKIKEQATIELSKQAQIDMTNTTVANTQIMELAYSYIFNHAINQVELSEFASNEANYEVVPYVDWVAHVAHTYKTLNVDGFVQMFPLEEFNNWYAQQEIGTSVPEAFLKDYLIKTSANVLAFEYYEKKEKHFIRIQYNNAEYRDYEFKLSTLEEIRYWNITIEEWEKYLQY